MVKVKVCGITSVEDALKSVEFGADALGFNFYPPSPRYLTPEQAWAIVSEVPREVCRIAVVVNEPRARVKEIIGPVPSGADGPAFSGVQFHGEEDPKYCEAWEVKVIKAFRVRNQGSLATVGEYPADFYLLDSWSDGYGGSGYPFQWEWIEGLDPTRVILSGGLNLNNVVRAVTEVRPIGVDVCSGVEARPGIKDYGKLKEFILAAKAS